MSQKALSIWLKVIIILMAICGLVFYFYVFPIIAVSALSVIPTLVEASFDANVQAYFWWIRIMWISAIPCYIVLILGWLIASNIGKDKSFTKSNAKYLMLIMIATLIDCIFFFIANVVMLRLGYSSEMIFIVAIISIFAGIVIAVAAAALSHLVLKAAELQEENDLTI